MSVRDFSEQYLKLRVVIGSTRPGRVGPAVAAWLASEAGRSGDFDVGVIDIKSFDLPVFDEPKHPKLGQYEHAHTLRWAKAVDSSDAFVFVMPEYNHFAPSSLINAMTYLSREWNYKAAAIVSYGGHSGGIRAAQSFKPLLAALRMSTALESIAIPNVSALVEPGGGFTPSAALSAAVPPLLTELNRLARALKHLRGACL